MEKLSKEELTNGNYYLLTVRYPCISDASNLIILKSPNPEKYIEDNSTDLIEEVIYSFGYLDGLDDIEDNDEYDSKYDEVASDVNISYEAITDKVVDDYGMDYLNSLSIDGDD